MSLSRLSFLYPTFRRVTSCRYRHGSAVEPTLPHREPPPPDPPHNDSEIGRKVGTEELEILAARTELILTAIGSGTPPAKEKEKGKEKVEELGEEKVTVPNIPMITTTATSDPVPPTITNPFAPREYTHHFDTYNIVQRLQRDSRFTRGQSITVMKAIRGLLDKNMASASAHLVSKSNIENETYLFRAACSELRGEVQLSKKVQTDTLNSERTRIQTEFDLLNQSFLAEVMNLKDELNGMFNDRKMVTRAEQRAMENKIQELNYKITILINSDLKSEIEKLRWTTTRRGLIAIASLALFVVASIRVNNSSHEKEKKEKEKEKEREKERKNGGSGSTPEAEAANVGLISMG